jgi:ubiquinone biosynthesis protein COQ4
VINFIKAVYHWSRIRKDKPVDRPKRIFKILSLFGTKRYMKTRDKFLSNPDTAALLERDKTLSVLMSNYTEFKRYKKGTLGKDIYEFMQSEEVDYAKLIADFGGFTDGYDARERDIHDIIHVVFGYSRSRFGEGATIATHYWQGNSFGLAFAVFMGIARQMLIQPSAAKLMYTAIRDVYKRQKGINFHAYPFEDNLTKDINTIRYELSIPSKTLAIQTVDRLSKWD